jgi:glyoxylase-like metal-dependent hydrolase (beta-lactamase superfamily II)
MPAATRLPASGQDDAVYNLYSLCFARRSGRIRDNFVIRDMHDGPMPLEYNLWIAHNSARTVLIDTGFAPDAAERRNRALLWDPIEALGRLGFDTGTIEDVVLTHLHYDHCGNIDRLPRARFHVQDAEVAYATGRCMCEPHLRIPFEVEDITALVRKTFAGRVCFHEGDASPLPGISVHFLPGHSAGMQAVRISTPRGPVVLASDVSHYYANLLRRAPFVITLDAAQTLRSYSKLQDLAGSIDRIIPGHDPLVRTLYPNLSVNGVELTALHEVPKAHDAQLLAGLEYPE